uniref:Tudor domain containing 1 n=1 Tax=Echeneis naucrates TaxID=173247 RepID=A0A665VK44_ECHNA
MLIAVGEKHSPSMVRPNLPLRKPSTSPMAFSASSPPPAYLSRPNSTPESPFSGASGDGNSTQTHISVQLLDIVLFTQTGYFRCKRCKRTPYCSVLCQTEDWKAHRHVCKAFDPEPTKENPKEITVSPAARDRAGQLKNALDSSSLQRVYLKDLDMTNIVFGTDIQATVVEFYSPARIFLLAQTPQVQEALQRISTELQKTYKFPSTTTYIPCVREVCAVQFSHDLNWYRGLVQALAADQKTAYILYIDFGNEENVPVDRIRPLVANIPRSCPCVLECCIAGVVPLDGNWSAECCVAMRQLLAGKTVTVRPVGTVENGCVHTVNIQLSTGKQLSTFLLEHNYATKETVTATPTQQDISAMMNVSLANFKRCSIGKDENNWAQPPEPLTQAVGDSISVVVTHLQSPNEIIIQKVENAGVIQDLQLKLREHCCNAPVLQNFRPAPGTVCCAQFSEDKQWYRAKILAYPSEERVCVGYLDFGNSEDVDLGQLRPISASLLALPMQAMRCGLAGVQPVGEQWSEECLLALQRRVSNRILRIDIHGAHEGKALVTMIDEGSDPQANVAELLICADYAAPAPVSTSSNQQVNQTVIPPAEPHVPAPVCEPMVWSFAKLPCDGQTVALLVNVVENPGEFYCTIDQPTVCQRLMELGTELKKHCDGDNSPYEPKVGEPCCAMFPANGAWYRALVKEKSENLVSVNTVDYGFSMKVEKHHLRSITPGLLSLPFQAVCCWLSGAEPLGSEWSSEALLWFQTLVDGKKLCARVLSVSKKGYGVELESRGQNVAASLISEQLAKAPGQIPRETIATADSGAKCQENTKENENKQMHAQFLNQICASYKETPMACQNAVPSEVPSFPTDWKTVELPLNETFQPYIAAISSPSLFFVHSPSQVDQQKLQELMTEVADFCSQALPSAALLCRPAPGAACCAQFSADDKWYRAVVLEASENEMSVIYADYCNTEKVPLSRILPIPKRLLQLPFQITRCTLSGKEHFPAEWPKEVQQMFQSILLNNVLATIQAFDGSANVLSLALPTERGGGDLTAMIVDSLQVQNKVNFCPASCQRADLSDSSTPTASTTDAPGCPQPKSVPDTQKGLELGPAHTSLPRTQAPTTWTQQEHKHTCAVSIIEDPVQKIVAHTEPPCTEANDPQTSTCCCMSLMTKIVQMEQLMQLQLSLVKLLVEQKK